MKTIKITPRGYCHGVVGAINTITNLDYLSMKTPIYILGMLVHNKQLINSLEEFGIITLHDTTKTRMELLEGIKEGTVIFTAHGISPKVHERALEKGLDVIDTTCGDVSKTQDIIYTYLDKGFDIIYIGKLSHPESEAAAGIDSKVHVIETIEDLHNLTLSNKNLAMTNQTTMSIFDVFNISEEAKRLYPFITVVDEICNATRIRQEAIMNQEKVDHCFIVGDKLSNNSKKLSIVSNLNANIPSTLIEGIEDIDIEFLKTLDTVSVSSGASTPTKVTQEVIEYLEQFEKDNPKTYPFGRREKFKSLLTKRHSK